MDAKSLHALVKDWPREAWPEGFEWVTCSCSIPTIETLEDGQQAFKHRAIWPQHATLLFEASGMRYIVEGGLHVVEVEDCGDSGWWIGVRKLVRADPDAWVYRGHVTAETPEPIHAISAAVLAMAERSKK